MRKTTHLKPISFFALALAFGVAGCHKNPAQDQAQNAAQVTDDSQDPAMQANLAPVNNTSADTSAQSQQAAPAPESAPAEENPPPPPPDQTASTAPSAAPSDQSYDYNAVDQSYQDQAQPVEYATAPPPPLPEYQQPECPGDNYLWTPGYWGYAPTGYYWVPGVWVISPYIGALWTPGYWGFYGGRYWWHHGYWGPHIGFYGGVNYGYGYVGVGYVGGYWHNNTFMYNRSVTVVNTTIVHNVYVHNVTIVNNTRVSYNGGRGGITARPLPAERVALREQHIGPLPEQVSLAREASTNREQWASVNRGRPAVAVAARPLASDRRAPAAMPPVVQNQVRQERAEVRPVNPAQESRPTAENRPAEQPNRLIETQRSETRPAPQAENRPQPRPEYKPAPETQRPVQQPEARPAPQPQQRPEYRPAPQSRPEYRPAPQPQSRPEERPETRPAPEQRSQPRPEGRPAPHEESRPAPRPEERKPQ